MEGNRGGGEKGGRDRRKESKVAGRRYLRVVCRNAIRSDFDTFRYPIPANISAIDTSLSFVLRNRREPLRSKEPTTSFD